MAGHPPRPRRVVDPGCARDCIQPRDNVLGGGQRASPARRQARNEGKDDELLQQLPAALGGYRAPASASPAPPQPGERRQPGQHRAASADGSAQQRPDQAHGQGGGQQRHRQAPPSGNPIAGGQQREQGGKPKLSPDPLGQRRAASVDGSAQQRRTPWAVDGTERHEQQSHGQGGGQQRQPPWAMDGSGPGALTMDFSVHRRNPPAARPAAAAPPWAVDSPSGQPKQHARDSPQVPPHLPDIRSHGRGGRDSPHGSVLPGQGQRGASPASRVPGRVAADAPLARSVSKAADANAQFRPYMEDRYISVDPFMPGESSEQWAFFAVYDGHGGTMASEHCNKELHKQLAGELRRALKEQPNPSLPLADEAIADALTRTFEKTDKQLEKIGAIDWGCTATVALVRRSGSGLRLHVANVGDSRALAIHNARGHARVSEDHRPSDEAEARRVRQEGGFVQMSRVSGVLAVSRALGDFAFKSKGVSWRPSITVREATNDIALVIASDGLWDYLGDGDVRSVIEIGAKEQSFDLAKQLVVDAKRKASTDNICCLVIFW